MISFSGNVFMKRVLLAGAAIIILYLFMNPYYLFPDGQGYFAYLPSLFFDRDLDFFNDFTAMRVPIPLAMTEQGYISNNWPFGAAFFWSPFYIAAKLLASQNMSPYATWFWYWVNFATLFYGALSLFFLYDALKKIGDTASPRAIVILALFGSTMFFYTGTISSTAHGISAFIVTLFVWYWVVSLPDRANLKRYMLLGIFLGLAFMVRQQEAIFGIIVLAELAHDLRKEMIPALKRFFVFAGSFVLGAFPQLLIWKIIHGSFFYAPSKFNVSLQYFSLTDVLFSSFHGIAFWTPVLFIAFVGLAYGAVNNSRVYAGLFLAFVGQVLVNASCIAYWEGYSFGLRQMTSSFPVIALGMAGFIRLFEKKQKGIRILGWLLLVVPCAWTIGLLVNYYLGLDLLAYISPGDLVQNQMRLPNNLLLFFKRFKALSRPSPLMAGAMIMTGALCALFLNSWKKKIERGSLTGALAFLVVVLMGCSVLLVQAHGNKPQRGDVSSFRFVTPRALDEYFVGQVKEIKRQMKEQDTVPQARDE